MERSGLLIAVVAVVALAGCKTTEVATAPAPAPPAPVVTPAPIIPAAPPAPLPSPPVTPAPIPAPAPPPPPPAAASGLLTEAELARADAILEARCAQCHGTEVVRAAVKSREDWGFTIDRMVDSHRAVLPDSERPLLLRYLAQAYGPR